MLIVLSLHLALLLVWPAHLSPRRAPAASTPEVWTWLLQPSPAPAVARSASPVPRAGDALHREPAPPTPRLAAEPATPRVLPPRPDLQDNSAPGIELAPAVAPVVQAAPAPPDPASGPTGSMLMNGDATRRAIREAARQPLLSERAAQATEQPFHRSAERLADAASAAGKGDCLQGEYAGGGMGLLSLPFLAVAAARGRCAR